MVRELSGGKMKRRREPDREALERRARADADEGAYFAVRRLFAQPTREPITVGILGPYESGDEEDTAFFADAIWPGGRLFACSKGDRFMALSLGVELCRVHLIHIMRQYPEGLSEESGAPYQQYDLPSAPEIPPPFDFDRIKRHRTGDTRAIDRPHTDSE